MGNQKLAIGFGEYDRTRIMVDGVVKIDGVDASYHPYHIVTEVFEAMIKDRGFDVSELGMSYFLRTMDFEDPPFLAIPAFPNRCFRHSAIYVNVDSGIERPEDIAGKTVGEFAMYGHDAGVWPKGILSDDFGVKPEQCKWIIGSLDWPLKPIDFVPQPHPAGIEITSNPEADLGAMLEAGEIAALISADVPKCFLEKSPKVKRLFMDYVTVEREYFQRTGIFPIMHTVVVRKDLASEHPDVVRAVYKAFCEAKEAVREHYKKGMIFNNMATMMPWFSRIVAEDISILGDDWWPYGLQANRKAVDTFLRYHYEQGLSKRQLTCDDIFVKELLDT
jgi:4,5-dihydroxyphthalate decarboxylase